VKEARVAVDGTGRSKGFAFVTMENTDDVEECIKGK
jgi:RNA recognition motif-containing protein